MFLCKSDNIDFQWICVKLTIREITISICCVYIKSGSNLSVYESFLESFEMYDELRTGNLFIIGDFNVSEINGPLYNLENGSSKAKIIHDIICSFDLYSINHVLNQVNNTLDLVLTNITEARVTVSSNPLVNIDLYHPPLEINFEFTAKKSIQTFQDESYMESRHNYDFKRGDFVKLYYLLSQCDWSTEIYSDNPNECVEQYYSTLYGILDQCVPQKQITKNHKYPAWYTKELIMRIRLKEHFFKMSKRNPVYEQRYRELRADVKQTIRACHSNYINSIEDNINTNPKNFWEYIKCKRNNSNIAFRFSYEDQYFEKDVDIANAYAKYFESVYSDSQPLAHNTELKDYHLSILSIDNITENEIHNAIQALKPKSSVGVDGLPSYFFKAYADIMKVPLKIIFSIALKNNTFPNLFKIGRITPIHKSGNTSLIANYRPITVLPTPSKILERVIYNRIYPHVSPVILEEQHGFVNKKSTVTNLCVFSDYIAKDINNSSQTDTVYTDIAKAFDRVNHRVLIQGLQSFSFHKNLLSFLDSYLVNRPQFVKFNNVESYRFIASSGVPQGSILGPLLFVMFVNDISDYIKHAKFLLYADDLKLYLTIKTIGDTYLLQRDLHAISNFCKDKDLAFNESKCKVVTYTRKESPFIERYTINGIQIERLNEIKDLGVTFTSTFSFNRHIIKLTADCYRQLGFILRATHDFTCGTCMLLFNSYVRSKLEYACIIWNPKTFVHSEMLEKVQKRFLRSLYLKKHGVWPHLISYSTQLIEFNASLLSKRREAAQILFIYNILHDNFNAPEISYAINFNVPDIRLRIRNCMFKISNLNSPTEQCLLAVNNFLRNCDIDIRDVNRNVLLSYL